MTRPHPATVVAVVLITVGVVGAVATVGRVGVSTPTLGPGIAWVGWLLIIPTAVLSQMYAYWVHARGIRKGNFARIVGKGLALILFGVAVFMLLGGHR